MAGDLAFDPAEMLQVDDDAFPDPALHRSEQKHSSRRNVLALARIFLAIGQHVAAEQRHGDALVSPAFALA